MNRSSRLFQKLTPEEIAAVIRSAFPKETVQSATLLTGGLFNTTYRVITSAHDLVLRLGPVHPELLLPFEENLMQAECRFDQLCAKHGIPVSRVLCCDTSHSVLDRDIMIVEYIESIPLSDASISPEALPALHEECGRLTRLLHAITGEQFGRLSDILRGNGHASWSEAVLSEYRALFQKAEPYAVFPPELVAHALAFAKENRFLLDRIAVPHLVHADLWAGNVLVQKQNDTFHVCALIDGDRAYFGDADYDLATPWLITPDFLRGYGEIDTLFSTEERKRKRRVTEVLLALTDSYVWLVEYNNEANYKARLADAENLLAL